MSKWTANDWNRTSFGLRQVLQPNADTEHWLLDDCQTASVAPDRAIVRNRRTGATAEITVQVHALLGLVRGSKTLIEHAKEIRVRFGSAAPSIEEVVAVLRGLASAGILRRESECIVQWRRADYEPPPAPLWAIVVRTCDRPQLLARLVQALQAREEASTRHYRFVVLDDSRAHENRVANKASVDRARLDIEHVDLSRELPLQAALLEEVPSARSSLQWIFQPGGDELTYGRPVNIALLLGAGRRFLTLDDDALPAPLAPSWLLPGLEVSSDRDDWDFHASESSLRSALQSMSIDPFAAHEGRLGARFADVLAESGAERLIAGSLDRLDYSRLRNDSRILFTQNAAAGDPGSSLYPTQFFEFQSETLSRLTLDEDHYRRFLEHRFNIRGTRRHRIAPTRNLTLTTLAGFDARVILPPTMRSWRNEDLLLGEAALYVHPRAVMYDFPWALLHLRDPVKRWLPLDAAEPFRQDANHFLIEQIAEAARQAPGDDPEQRIRQLAEFVSGLAETSQAALVERLEAHLVDTRSRIAFAIRSAIDESPSAPAFWRRDAEAFLKGAALRFDSANVRAHITDPASLRPALANYAQLLHDWPRIWRFCASAGRIG